MAKRPNASAGRAQNSATFTSIDELYAVLKPVMRAIAAAVGPNCEVVLHDLTLRQMDQTIYAIENGHVTNRSVGGPSTNLGLVALQEEASDHDTFGYHGRTADGRDLHSSSVYYRNADGALIGALCINVDLTAVQDAQAILRSMLPADPDDTPHEILSPDIQTVLEEMINSAIKSIGKPVSQMTKSDRIELLALLEQRGAFHIKRAVDKISSRLGISKVTAYSDLDVVRNAR